MTKVIRSFSNLIDSRKIWNNSYGAARSLIAFGTLVNFLFNDSDILFRPGSGLEHVPICRDYNGFSLFCLLDTNLEVARLLVIGLLVLIVSGWRPRVTGVLHWYLMYSYTTSATVIDGGDHIATIITLLLIPVTLADSRKSHWFNQSDVSLSFGSESNINFIKSIFVWSCLIVIRFQVSLIYLNSAGAKLLVEEWQNGTAVYYWFTHPTFGAPDWLLGLINPLITNRFSVTLVTWGVIFFEFILFSGILASQRTRKALMLLGILFHFGIFIIHGLFSFFFTMSGALVLYLWPLDQPFRKISILSKNVYRKIWTYSVGLVVFCGWVL